MTARSWAGSTVYRRLVLLLALGVVACASMGQNGNNRDPSALRNSAIHSTNPHLLARWLLGELLSQGGEPAEAKKARARLDAVNARGMWPSLARAIDDDAHGRPKRALQHYLDTIKHAQKGSGELPALAAWFATLRVQEGHSLLPDLWEKEGQLIEGLMAEPGAIGWRARAELVDLWEEETWARAGKNLHERVAKKHGCLRNVSLAGPFGGGALGDTIKSYPAEGPGTWPARWEKTSDSAEAPRILKSKRTGCTVYADEPADSGVFYAETFISLDAPRRMLVAAQGAQQIFVNDTEVLNRDPRRWGIWPKFGVLLDLGPGRHRVVTKMLNPATAIRVLNPSGTPLAVDSSRDARPGYTLAKPVIAGEPNALMRYVQNGTVLDPNDDVVSYLAAKLASHEGAADVAAMLFEPLTVPLDTATGLALETAAELAENDPILDASHTKDLMRERFGQAAKRDNGLWRSLLSSVLWNSEQRGPIPSVEPLRKLRQQFPQVPQVSHELSRVFREIGWVGEYKRSVRNLVERFPNDLGALRAALEVYDSEGDAKKADTTVAKIQRLAPDSEVGLTRALERRDYEHALQELERLSARRPKRKDLAERTFDVMVRAGNTEDTWNKLQAALKDNPEDGSNHLALADANLAAGKRDALSKALADAVLAGAETGELENALDLVEGMSALEPYRIDARHVIEEYEERGRHLSGTAARVLDYAAVWVHADGSSRMLEHEVIRVQSAEAISKFAEHPMLPGLVLHLRVIKKDGQILEPELVSGKPTVTLPHLEVGDYVETEQIIYSSGNGSRGRSYIGPQWFFREEAIAYARSEFVVIAPAEKDLIIETRNEVPAPQVENVGPLRVWRWRVDESAAAPQEPDSAPMQEFLPSVLIGWGIDLETRLREVHNNLVDLTPTDPRILRLAKGIVKGIGKDQPIERARKLYRWVLANVEDGNEVDGRRVVTGKNGNRWRGFITLCRALGLDVAYAIAKSSLQTEAVGPISKANEFTVPLLVLRSDGQEDTWLTVSSKHSPFGYVPAAVRGMPAYVLSGAKPHLTELPTSGALDGFSYSGTVNLKGSGAATAELKLQIKGKHAARFRELLAQLPEHTLHDTLEGRVLGAALRGARLTRYKVRDLDDLDRPLLIELSATVPHFAQKNEETLSINPPFMPQVSRLATLPSRSTPLLIGEATHHHVRLEIRLPQGAKLLGSLKKQQLNDGDRSITIGDRIINGKLLLERTIQVPASRVQPEEYPAFANFARRADNALSSSIRIGTAP